VGATLAVHIIAGSLGLVSGFIALYAAKGAPLHRKAGMVFVVVMLTMTLTGITIAAVLDRARAMNIPAGLITAYLVVTGFTAVRPPASGARGLAIGAMLLGMSVGIVCLLFGLEAVANGGTRQGMPAFPFFLFGFVGVFAGLGDLKMILSGRLPQGAARLARHLWRMCFALFIAAMSFFFGQAKVIPEPLRIRPLLALPVLAVFVTMLYWVWRVRVRRSLKGILAARVAEATHSHPARP